MKKITLFLSLIFFACSDKPDPMYTTEMFTMKINHQELNNVTITADAITRYIVEITTRPNIDSQINRQVVISVTKGTIAPIDHISSAPSTQITIPLINGRASFYFMAGREAEDFVIMSATIESITQTFNFVVHPCEPDYIILESDSLNPSITSTVNLTAFLLKNNPVQNYASNNLKIEFSSRPATAQDTIVGYIPAPFFTTSTFAQETDLVMAKTTLTTNGKPGSLVLKAVYTTEGGLQKKDSITLQFVP
jgi:hypothetical protein